MGTRLIFAPWSMTLCDWRAGPAKPTRIFTFGIAYKQIAEPTLAWIVRIKWLLKIALAFVLVAAIASAAAVLRWHVGVKSALSVACSIMIAILAITAFIALNWLFETKAQSIFKNWAAKQGYTILQFERAFRSGAFSFWTTSRGQVVYFITVRDNQGMERKACVRCGSFGSGVLFNDKIEIKWL
jgi:hypothetical protein